MKADTRLERAEGEWLGVAAGLVLLVLLASVVVTVWRFGEWVGEWTGGGLMLAGGIALGGWLQRLSDRCGKAKAGDSLR